MTQQTQQLLRSEGGKSIGRKELSCFWKSRHDVAHKYEENVSKHPLSSFRKEKSFDFVHVAIPSSKVPLFRRAISSLAKKREIKIEEYGIWILPELFNFNFVREEDVAVENLERTVDDAMKFAVRLGGTIEYCHGSGVRLGKMLPLQLKDGLAVMRAIKHLVDPTMNLNPGKLGLDERSSL